ncbi:uncharacterized protein [Drosophila kikkawai]|nr:uncharacterized protein LOC108073876 [Drosophila kikkawai]
MPPIIQLYRRRDFPCRNLHHLQAGDFHVNDEEEDPRQRGVLHTTSCRRHRDRLRSSRHSHLLQGFSTFAAVLVVLLLLIFLGIEMASDPMDVKESSSLWNTALRWVGLEGESISQGKEKDIPESDSCSQQTLDLPHIFRLMGKQVLNQELALGRMERALTGNGRFHSVVLMGPPGVGKTLTVNALKQNFPWPANAHSYSWNTVVSDEVMKFRLVRQFADGLSNCGSNLLIIDNLATCDHGLVPIYNRLIREREGELDRNQRVLVIYVFTLEADMYWEQFELLQQLARDTTIVNFRFFGRDDLRDCLANELRVEQRQLSKEKESVILEKAIENTEVMGCKGLRLQILQHGEHIQKPVVIR